MEFKFNFKWLLYKTIFIILCGLIIIFFKRISNGVFVMLFFNFYVWIYFALKRRVSKITILFDEKKIVINESYFSKQTEYSNKIENVKCYKLKKMVNGGVRTNFLIIEFIENKRFEINASIDSWDEKDLNLILNEINNIKELSHESD